jgi:hypothetical protein
MAMAHANSDPVPIEKTAKLLDDLRDDISRRGGRM